MKSKGRPQKRLQDDYTIRLNDLLPKGNVTGARAKMVFGFTYQGRKAICR